MKNKITDILRLKIYYEDTDASGIVYHSKYLNFAERGRSDFLRKFNLTNSNVMDKYAIRFVVKKLNINYLGYACLDDNLIIKTEVSKLSKARLIFKQAIFKNKNKITELLVEVCSTYKDGKVARIPNDIYYELIN
tara:strand:- start:487 stop:891 length:405 start_codon:yes stop_codon:yes gene_type:complete